MENLQIQRTRSGKLLGTVVTKKTVQETVEVIVTPFDSWKGNNSNNQVELEVISTSTKENENEKVEGFNSSMPGKSPLRKVNIVFRDETEDGVIKEVPLPQHEEDDEPGEEGDDEERRKKEQWRKEEHDNEIEKQQTRDIQNSKHKRTVDQLEKKGMNMQDKDETQPSSEAIPPPPPQLPEAEEERMEVDEESRVAEKAKQAEEEIGQEELSKPPRYEGPQKKVEESDKKMETLQKKVDETNKKKRKTSGEPRKGGVRKRRSRRRGGDIAADYKTYTYRVLKQVHPDLGISSEGMATINSFLNDMYEKIADEAGKLSRYTDGKTLSVRDMQNAVKLVLPGELGKHAMAEGMKAVHRYAIHTQKEAVVQTPNVR